MSNNPDLTKTQIQEKVIKNLAKDPLHYVKNGQFGGEGLGYSQSKMQKAEGKHAGSGYSEKLKDSDNTWDLVKESIGGVVTNGSNPWYGMMNSMLDEEKDANEARQEAIQASKENAGIKESDELEQGEEKPKKEKTKVRKPKKETIDSKLAEIGKQGDVVKMEAQINFLEEIIEEKENRLNSISEDENLSELVDKKKMKEMQREVKLLGKKKAQMEKVYEKMCGKAYQKTEIVDEVEDIDEMDEVSFNDKTNPTQGATGERDPKKVGTSTSDYSVNR
jgi:hypothetical protein